MPLSRNVVYFAKQKTDISIEFYTGDSVEWGAWRLTFVFFVTYFQRLPKASTFFEIQ